MKKQIIFGLVLITTMSSLKLQAASLGGAKGMHEVISDYAKEIKKSVDPKGQIRFIGLEKRTVVFNTLTKELEVPASKNEALKNHILYRDNYNPERPLEILSKLVAAKKITAGKTDAESKSISASVDAMVSFMADSTLIGARKTSKFLGKTDYDQVASGIRKILDMPDQILLSDKADRELFTAVMEKTQDLALKSETYEEAFVRAIMDVKGVSKEQAIKIARRFTSCE
jgi:hypothetical protein